VNLLFLASEAYGAPGGIAQYNRDLIRALSESNHFSRIKIMVRAGLAEAPMPKGVAQDKPRNNKLKYTLVAIAQSLRFRPALIFCGHLNMLPLCWLLHKVANIPFWIQLHGIDAWERPPRLIRFMSKDALVVTSVSRYTRQRFLAWSTMDPARVKVLPNTVKRQFTPVDRTCARTQFGIDEGQKVLLTVGRLSTSEAYKGQDRVLQVLPALIRHHTTLVYLIAGDGDDRLRLEALAAKLGVTTHVRFLGAVSEEELNALYNAADLYVMPSTGEGFGIVYLEAMAAGTPALGLDCDGSVDPLRDGALGIVSDEKNLAQSVSNALKSPRDPSLADKTLHYFGDHAFKHQVSRIITTFNVQP
jgi:phosphatidyl-myo-inositol dimannoside synthase